MSSFLTFYDKYSLEQVGNKFANMAGVHQHFPIPSALCVTVDVFLEALGEKRINYINQFFEDLNATVGCFLLSSITELEDILRDISLQDRHKVELKKKLSEVFGDGENMEFAVRSSGLAEDSESSSFAGVYKSKLYVKGFDGICDAIVECWKAYYSYSAIAARIRVNNFNSYPGMAVIIQEMVNAQMAGVAFTSSSCETMVEYVYGIGEDLVSGIKAPIRYSKWSEKCAAESKNEKLEEVCSAIEKLREILGYQVDMEWAWDQDGFHVLQVRPVTAKLDEKTHAKDPIFYSARLYLDSSLPNGMELGDCRDVYINYMSKRGSAYRKAEAGGIENGKGFIIDFNGLGLKQNFDFFKNLVNSNSSEKFVLDINNNIRQVIIHKNELLGYLISTFDIESDMMKRNSIIIREFIKGQFGLISRITADDGFLLEYSEEGLLGINRGIIDCKRVQVINVNSPLKENNLIYNKNEDSIDVILNCIPKIVEFTIALNEDMPGTQVEWVIDNENPFFVDFSAEHNLLDSVSDFGNLVISSGIAQGPLLTIDEDDTLYRLSVGAAISVTGYHEVTKHDKLKGILNMVSESSQKPIVYVKKPYVILSTLFENVAGFIFEEGSLLCHLAILLREAKIPAVISKTVKLSDKDVVMIENDRVTIFERNGAENEKLLV